MTWIPEHEMEAMKKIIEMNKQEFIEKVRKADWAFSALVETMSESADFDSYPNHQKSFIRAFMKAKEIIKEEDKHKT